MKVYLNRNEKRFLYALYNEYPGGQECQRPRDPPKQIIPEKAENAVLVFWKV